MCDAVVDNHHNGLCREKYYFEYCQRDPYDEQSRFALSNKKKFGFEKFGFCKATILLLTFQHPTSIQTPPITNNAKAIQNAVWLEYCCSLAFEPSLGSRCCCWTSLTNKSSAITSSVTPMIIPPVRFDVQQHQRLTSGASIVCWWSGELLLRMTDEALFESNSLDDEW